MLVGECFIAIPSASETEKLLDKSPSDLTFTGRSFKPGYILSQENENSTTLERWVAGILKINVLWACDEEGNSCGPKPGTDTCKKTAALSADPLQQVGPAGTLSIRKLMVILFVTQRIG